MLLYATLAATRPPPFSAPPGYNPTAPAYTAGPAWPTLSGTAAVEVTVGAAVHNSTPYVFGSNAPVYWGRRFSRKPETVEQIKSGPTFLRWPGGSPANEYVWDPACDGVKDTSPCWAKHPYFERWHGQYGSGYLQTPDELMVTCRATGAEPLIQMNAALALVEGVANATAMSLALLRYFKRHDFPIRYVSFGNENARRPGARIRGSSTQ